MNFYAFSGLLTFITSLGFGIFSWIKGTKWLNKIWAIFCFCVAIWGLGCFKFSSILNTDKVFFWLRIGHVGVILMPVFFLHFVLEFLELKKLKTLLFIYVLGIVFSIVNLTDALNYTNLLIANLRFVFNEFYVDSPPARLYPILLCYYFGTIIYAHYYAFKQYRHSNVLKKNQMKYFLMATVLGFSGGATSFFMVFGVDIYPALHITVPLYPAIMTYAIINYKLMDIEVIIRKTLVFAGLFAMAMTMIGIATTIAQSYIGRVLNLDLTLTASTGAIIAILLSDPTKKLLINLTDRFLFQKKFKLTTIVAQASQAIALVQSLKWLSRRIVAFLVTICRIKNAVVYIRYGEDQHFLRGAYRGYPLEELPLENLTEEHAMIRYLRRTRRPIEMHKIKDELGGDRSGKIKDELGGDPSGKMRADLEQIVDFLMQAKAEAIIPSFLQRRIELAGIGKEKVSKEEEFELRNILVLGSKKSDEPYSEDELEVFYGLAQESAIAIENARLYDEAVKRSRELAQINQELEDTNERLRVTQASLIVAEKNATMVGMAKAIAHEVNNPLSTVDGRARFIFREHVKVYSDIMSKYGDAMSEDDLRKYTRTLKETADYARRINVSAGRIAVVVKTLTNLLKNTKGEMGPLSLIVLCQEAVEATRFSTYEENLGGCDIKLDIASNVFIRGNQEQLLQVFVNLIKNSYEAMMAIKAERSAGPQTGRPTSSSKSLPAEAMMNQIERRIVIRGDNDSDDPKMARIEVSDNGPGIPPEILTRIWMQGFTTKQRKDDSLGAPGQGQGLFVCKHMIESVHGGVIYVESAVGKGTTFIIKLPLAEIEAIA